MTKRIIILILIIIAVIGGFFLLNKKPITKNNGLPFIAANPGISGDEFKFTEEQTKQYNDVLTQALKYKSEGDQGNTASYQKALELYAQAAQIGQGRVWVPYLDLGNVYRAVKNFSLAEAAYNEGLKITSEALIYQAKIELYQYDLKKSPAEVIALYEDAIDKTVENVNLFIGYGYYLEQNGYFKEALTVFEQLVSKYPDKKDFQQEVADLKKKV